MKEPARTDNEFRKKIDGLFRELHSIKGEASALNLMSVAHRTHALEDMVSELKKKPELSGNDFLPIVLKLDELMAHLRSVRELGTRLSSLRGQRAAGGGRHRRLDAHEAARRPRRKRRVARRAGPHAALAGRAPGARPSRRTSS